MLPQSRLTSSSNLRSWSLTPVTTRQISGYKQASLQSSTVDCCDEFGCLRHCCVCDCSEPSRPHCGHRSRHSALIPTSSSLRFQLRCSRFGARIR
jgi:hypothetical protein